MADYQFNTDLGPKAQQGTSLGDLINTARGAQSYQQQQQLNPLQLQKAQMEVDQLKQMNPLAVRKAAAETGTSELGLNEKQTSTLYGLAGGVLNDPRLKSKDPHDVMGALYEAQQRASTFGLPKETVDGVFNPLFQVAQKNPAAVRQSINNIVDTQISPEGKRAMQTGGTVEINGVKYQYAPASGKLEQIGAGGAPAAPGVARIAPTQVGPAFTPGEVAKPEQGIPSKIGDYLSSEKGLNTLARLGLTGALGAFGATQARKAGGQTQAATAEQKAIAQPYTEQGKTLVGAAQRGELTPQSQQVLAAYKAQQAQGVATRGGVGQQQADAATANLYSNLLDNQYKYGLQIMQIGDNITLGAIKSGLQLDQQLQQTTNNFYSQLASIAAGGSGQIPFTTPAKRTE
jgi:hypothetical protein